MGDFTQPQQKYAGTCENCNIAIAIFYPGITISKRFYYLIKNDRDCNIAIFTSAIIFLLWLGEITHMR